MMLRQSTRNENMNFIPVAEGWTLSLLRGGISRNRPDALGNLPHSGNGDVLRRKSSSRAKINNFEFSGGFAYNTGMADLGGLTVGTSLWMNRRFRWVSDYDSVYDNSSIGTFELTSIGHTAVKSHLQNFVGLRASRPSGSKNTISIRLPKSKLVTAY